MMCCVCRLFVSSVCLGQSALSMEQHDHSVVEPETQNETFKTRALAEMEKIGKHHGGPAQYLWNMMPSDEHKMQFAVWLWDMFPEQDEHLYHHEVRLPPTSETDIGQTPPLCVHVAALGFDAGSSLKPPPGRELFKGLMEHMLQDGFCTRTEPLLVLQSRTPDTLPKLKALWQTGDEEVLPMFSLSYMKGFARVTSMFALLFWVWKHGIDLASEHRELYNSVCAVHVHHTEQASKIDEALKNMKLSSRGSLRKMTNVIQLVTILNGLFKHGLTDIGVFIRKWNQTSARTHLIVGKKAMAVKLLLDCAPKVIDCCFACLGKGAWQPSCWQAIVVVGGWVVGVWEIKFKMGDSV